MKKFIRKVGEKLGFIEENKTQDIMDERSELKKTMAKNLKANGFTDAEVEEVLSILTKCEKDVQIQKDLLIGTNINTDNPNPIMKEIFGKIREIELQAAADIKQKIAEIKGRKL